MSSNDYTPEDIRVRVDGVNLDRADATAGCTGCYFNDLGFNGACTTKAKAACSGDHVLRLSDTHPSLL